MKRIYSAALFCIVYLVLSAFIFSNLSTHHEVTGVLVDADQNPVAGLLVMLLNENEEQIASDQTNDQGRFTLIYQAEPTTADPMAGSEMPAEFKLGSTYPNPFNPRTTVPFHAPVNTRAIITVHNILGQEVLRTGVDISAGSHEIQINLGGSVSQGQYIFRVQGDGFSLAQNMTFVSAGIGGGNPEITVRHGGQASSSIPSSFHLINQEPKYRLVIPESRNFSSMMVDVPARMHHDLGTIVLLGKHYYDHQFGNVMDIDGNVYKTIVIGEQEWMAENLKVSRYRNGEKLFTGLSTVDSGSYSVYTYRTVDGIDSEAEMVAAYGSLYNWYAVKDPRGLCPVGWHIPTDDDWFILESHLGGPDAAGAKMKSIRIEPDPQPRWESPSWEEPFFGTNESGFSGLPAGTRISDGPYYSIGYNGLWWSSTKTEVSDYLAWYRKLDYDNNDLHRDYSYILDFFSVRCLRDK